MKACCAARMPADRIRLLVGSAQRSWLQGHCFDKQRYVILDGM